MKIALRARKGLEEFDSKTENFTGDPQDTRSWTTLFKLGLDSTVETAAELAEDQKVLSDPNATPAGKKAASDDFEAGKRWKAFADLHRDSPEYKRFLTVDRAYGREAEKLYGKAAKVSQTERALYDVIYQTKSASSEPNPCKDFIL
jgi:hypothetical protein